MSELTELILFSKFVGILKSVKIREFQEFLKFIKFEFSIYANTYSRQHVNATADKQASNGMRCSAGLKMPIQAHFFSRTQYLITLRAREWTKSVCPSVCLSMQKLKTTIRN